MSKRKLDLNKDSKNKLMKTDTINKNNAEGYTQLHKAILDVDYQLVVKLLELEADPAISVTKHRAHSELAENNFAQGYNLQNGDNAMHLAMRAGNKDIVEILHSKNSNLFNMRNLSALTPVDVAASVGNLEVINFFLKVIKPTYSQFEGHYLGLVYAIYNQHEEVAKTLIESGWDINGGEKFGHSSISMAVYKLPNLVEILLRHGANVNSPDYNGFPPIYDAINTNNNKMLKILLENGAKVVTTGMEDAAKYSQRINSSKEILELLNISCILDLACGDNLDFNKDSLKEYIASCSPEDARKNINSVFDRVMHRILQRKLMSPESVKSSINDIIKKVTEFGEEYNTSILLDLINNLKQFSIKFEFFATERVEKVPSLFTQSYKVLTREDIWNKLVKEQNDYEEAKAKSISLNNNGTEGIASALPPIPRLPEVVKDKVNMLNEVEQLLKDMGVILKPTFLTEENNVQISAAGESPVNQDNIAPE